jgi:glutamate dehydrogenase
MTRPELSILLAYAKRRVYQDLVQTALPDTPYLVRDLERYFPAAIVARFGHLLEDHPLKREIIAMLAATDVVNSQGITFVSRMQVETGASGADVVRAFRIARDVTGAIARWDDVEALDGVIEPELQIDLLNGVDWLVESTSRWYLVQAAGQRIADAIESARDRFAELADVLDQIGPDAWREEHEAETERLREAGVPESVARRHAFQAELVHAPDIIAVSTATGRAPLEVARGFFLLGERLEIDWLEHRLDELAVSTRWRRWAKQSMEDDLLAVRRALCELVLEHAGGAPIDEAVDAFLEAHAEQVGRVQRFVRQLAVEGVTDLAQLTVALRQMRALAS